MTHNERVCAYYEARDDATKAARRAAELALQLKAARAELKKLTRAAIVAHAAVGDPEPMRAI